MKDHDGRTISVGELRYREVKAAMELFERNARRVHERKLKELLQLEEYLAATREKLEHQE